jgi:hypothetical protein
MYLASWIGQIHNVSDSSEIQTKEMFLMAIFVVKIIIKFAIK